jgi:hypothetical protein
MSRARLTAIAALVSCALSTVPAQEPATLDALGSVVSGLSFRNIGPFCTAAWVTEVAVPENPPLDHL